MTNINDCPSDKLSEACCISLLQTICVSRCVHTSYTFNSFLINSLMKISRVNLHKHWYKEGITTRLVMFSFLIPSVHYIWLYKATPLQCKYFRWSQHHFEIRGVHWTASTFIQASPERWLPIKLQTVILKWTCVKVIWFI